MLKKWLLLWENLWPSMIGERDEPFAIHLKNEIPSRPAMSQIAVARLQRQTSVPPEVVSIGKISDRRKTLVKI